MDSTNIVVTLDTRRQKRDTTYPLIFRIGHNRRTTSINLGFSVKEEDWDDINKVVKKSYVGTETVSRLNNIIQKKKSEATDILLKLHETGQLKVMDVAAVRERIICQNKPISFFTYAAKLIAELKLANRNGTARSYQGVINVLKSFAGGKDLSFHAVNYSFLTKLEAHHRSNGNGVNGLAVYMRTIRAIYNKAIKEGVAEKDHYPFNDYKVKTTPTEKRALDISLLKKIISAKLPADSACFKARNYFLASYMMYGMNFTDMAFLRKEDIKDGRILYRRRKTGKLYDIKISDSLKEIITHFSNQNPSSPYVFPIIKRETLAAQNIEIMWARKRYNKKLKLLAECCGIEQNLTSYVSRHSFATQAMMHQVPLNAISSMLGHSSLKTTEVYLKSLPSNILDEYNSSILQAL